VKINLDLHLIVDNNYGTHKHAEVVAWLERHPRFHLQLASLRSALPSASPQPRHPG
jgi:hypothetical protein